MKKMSFNDVHILPESLEVHIKQNFFHSNKRNFDWIPLVTLPTVQMDDNRNET